MIFVASRKRGTQRDFYQGNKLEGKRETSLLSRIRE